jgi:hypothetical protein
MSLTAPLGDDALPPGVLAQPPAPPASPSTEDLQAQIAALAALVRQAVPGVPPAPAPAPAAPKPPLALRAGQLVRHTSQGLEREVTQTGVVLEVLEGDRVTVGWFAGVSGPIYTGDLAAP